jgi:hypothetical protein
MHSAPRLISVTEEVAGSRVCGPRHALHDAFGNPQERASACWEFSLPAAVSALGGNPLASRKPWTEHRHGTRLRNTQLLVKRWRVECQIRTTGRSDAATTKSIPGGDELWDAIGPSPSNSPSSKPPTPTGPDIDVFDRLMQAIARQTQHAGQVTLTLSSTHGDQHKARRAYLRIAGFLARLRETAEQLDPVQRWYRILSEALKRYLKGRQLDPPHRLAPA